MQQEAWETSEKSGFHEGVENLSVPTKLMLIVSEASEALEVFRDCKDPATLKQNTYTDKGKPEGMPSELADIVIRVGDLAGIIGFDLEAAIVEKMAFNKTRPHRHGGRRV